MNAQELRALIRECEALTGITDASSHRRARIWRETVDKASGQVTREPAAFMSPLALAMNRLYDGRFGPRWPPAWDARSESDTLTSEPMPKSASGEAEHEYA